MIHGGRDVRAHALLRLADCRSKMDLASGLCLQASVYESITLTSQGFAHLTPHLPLRLSSRSPPARQCGTVDYHFCSAFSQHPAVCGPYCISSERSPELGGQCDAGQSDNARLTGDSPGLCTKDNGSVQINPLR